MINFLKLEGGENILASIAISVLLANISECLMEINLPIELNIYPFSTESVLFLYSEGWDVERLKNPSDRGIKFWGFYLLSEFLFFSF